MEQCVSSFMESRHVHKSPSVVHLRQMQLFHNFQWYFREILSNIFLSMPRSSDRSLKIVSINTRGER
jgi:hypothetical protein